MDADHRCMVIYTDTAERGLEKAGFYQIKATKTKGWPWCYSNRNEVRDHVEKATEFQRKVEPDVQGGKEIFKPLEHQLDR